MSGFATATGMGMKRDQLIQKRNAYQILLGLHEELSSHWAKAAQEFVQIASANIAIDTGMSIYSMMPLAETVDKLAQTPEATLAIFNNAISGRHLGQTIMDYKITGNFADGNKERNIEHGVLLGQHAFRINFGSQSRFVMGFEFDIRVFQYFLHEHGLQNRGGVPGGRQSLEKGRQAFMDYMETVASKFSIPNLFHILLTGEERKLL